MRLCVISVLLRLNVFSHTSHRYFLTFDDRVGPPFIDDLPGFATPSLFELRPTRVRNFNLSGRLADSMLVGRFDDDGFNAAKAADNADGPIACCDRNRPRNAGCTVGCDVERLAKNDGVVVVLEDGTKSKLMCSLCKFNLFRENSAVNLTVHSVRTSFPIETP